MEKEQVFLVTGASRGLGLAIARYLLQSSQNVIVVARSRDQLEALKTSYPSQVELMVADLADLSVGPKVVQLAMGRFGKVNGIVICHGVLTPIARMADASIEEWRKAFDINVFSGMALVTAAIPALRDSRGSVIWVSSGATTKAYTAWGAYGSSKAAMDRISAHFAVEEPDITSVSISPGRVDTDMQKVIRESGQQAMSPEEYASFCSAFEKGELFKPEDPGEVMARFVLKPDHSLSGRVLKWQAEELSVYRAP